MYSLRTPDVFASEIAEFLNKQVQGKEVIIKYPSSIKSFSHNCFFFIAAGETIPTERIRQYPNVLVLTNNTEISKIEDIAYIICENPKNDFIKVVNEFYVDTNDVKIAASAKIHPEAKIGRGVSVGENVVIDAAVTIGNNTIIRNNVVISGQVSIGKNCFIKDNSTIGSEGYDFEVSEDDRTYHLPHIGKIVIGDSVWIGTNTSIETPALDNTIIENSVKIDDFVHIGSHSILCKGVMIAAGTVISRQVYIGENSSLGANVSIRDNIVIEKNVIVGIGSVVIKNLEENSVYVGVPARLLRRL